MPKRVCVLSSEPRHNACAQLRLCFPLQSSIGIAGFSWHTPHDVQEAPALVTASISSSEIVIVQRSFPRPETASFLDTLVRNRPDLLVYETDDLLTDLPASHPEYARYAEMAPLTLAFLANCDGLIVSTASLGKEYAQYHDCIETYANALDLRAWPAKTPFDTQANSGGKPFRIGYVGSHTHAPDLAVLDEALERIARRYADSVRFVFVGCITPRIKALPGTEFHGRFIPYADYPAFLRSLQLDIALAPLADTPFNACKSDIKFQEYSAAGVPGVYANVGPYRQAVEHGHTGLLVDGNADAWYDAITQLIDDAPLAQHLARNAHAAIWSRQDAISAAAGWWQAVERIHKCALMKRTASEGSCTGIAPAMWRMALHYERALQALRQGPATTGALAGAAEDIPSTSQGTLAGVARRARNILAGSRWRRSA